MMRDPGPLAVEDLERRRRAAVWMIAAGSFAAGAFASAAVFAAMLWGLM